MNNETYIAFLRGINVGGKMVSMATLKKMLEDLGFTDVKTLLNSGNVIFQSQETDGDAITKTIEENLEKTFGFHIDGIIRTGSDIQSLIHADPFKDIPVTKETRLYVTFLSNPPTNTLNIPYESPEKDFTILRITDSEVCSVITLSTNKNTTDVMKILEKQFGKKITTRNWNTIQKIAKLL